MSQLQVQGNDVLLMFNLGEGFLPFVCAKDFSLEMTASLINKTTVGDGTANKYAYQSTDYAINCSGVVVFDADAVTAFQLVLMQQNFLEVPWKAIWVDKLHTNAQVYKGICLIERASLSANAGQVSLSDFSLKGSGAFSMIACDLAIGGIEISEAVGLKFATILDVTGGTPVSFAWQLDSGFEQSSQFSPITIGWPEDGEHVLTVTPICEDGSRGDPFSLDFLVTGQPGCASVINVNGQNITQTSFDVHFTIVGPAGSGYTAYVQAFGGGPFLEFTAAAEPIPCTGLSAGTAYFVWVKTLCGSEESGLSSAEIINTSP